MMSATPPQIVTQKSTEKRHSFYSSASTNNTLMGDWLERTKSRHLGAFGDSYPKVSPFSAKKQTVKELVSMQSFSNSNNKNEWWHNLCKHPAT